MKCKAVNDGEMCDSECMTAKGESVGVCEE